MKTMRMIDKLTLAAIATLAITAIAQDNSSVWNKLSVWEQSKQQQNKVEGVVKTFAHDESANRYVIKVKTSEGFKTLKICNDGIQSASNQSDFTGKNPNLDTLQQAMDKGKKVSVTYGGNWDKCIKGIQVEKAEESDTAQGDVDTEDTAEGEVETEESAAEEGFADL